MPTHLPYGTITNRRLKKKTSNTLFPSVPFPWLIPSDSRYIFPEYTSFCLSQSSLRLHLRATHLTFIRCTCNTQPFLIGLPLLSWLIRPRRGWKTWRPWRSFQGHPRHALRVLIRWIAPSSEAHPLPNTQWNWLTFLGQAVVLSIEKYRYWLSHWLQTSLSVHKIASPWYIKDLRLLKFIVSYFQVVFASPVLL